MPWTDPIESAKSQSLISEWLHCQQFELFDALARTITEQSANICPSDQTLREIYERRSLIKLANLQSMQASLDLHWTNTDYFMQNRPF